MQAIAAKNVHKNFGGHQVLKDVSFEVAKGQVFGFLGPNGAGKTTTIRCLMDYIRPSHGSISVLGKDSTRDAAWLKTKIGFLSSDLQLYPNWTAQEHLDLFKAIRGDLGVASDIAKRLGLNLDTKVKRLSSGNQQKLAITLAFCGHPELLIMDEPTRGLDPLLQNELYKSIREFNDSGGTVFLSSHNLLEVQRICHDIAVIKDGTVVAAKSMSEILSLKTHIIEALSEKPMARSDFAGKDIEIIHYRHNEIICRVKGDINPVLHKLSGYPLKDLNISHASLEETFMEYYK